MLSKIKLKINGMHCTSCALDIDFELEEIDGVKESKTHYAKEHTELVFDKQKVELKKIISKIKDLGYTADVLNP
jgi:P-type Cu+ transporter